ncbi:MAG: ATP-binding protein [Candidatus Bathyarchaeota archaeon]|nr:ATP-binding protein [Candidatus Bathyarchaeota archaeon]
MEGMKTIGYALSGCTHDFLSFVVLEKAKVEVNNFYFIQHPIKMEAPVLVRTFRIQPYNPEMITGRTGPLAGMKGRKADYGKKLEYTVAFAEILGYYDENHKWRMMEVAPSPWDPIYEPTEERLKEILIPDDFAENALMLEIGKVRGTKIPVYIDLNAIAKGHMLVAGMTRSGKSSFTINLVVKASELRPKPRFIIFDRRGEYGALTKYGAVTFPYNKFTPMITSPESIVSKLELKRREKAAVLEAIRALTREETEITRENIFSKTGDVLASGVIYKTPSIQKEALKSIEWFLETKGGFIDEAGKPMDAIEAVRNNPILIVNFSIDTNIEDQQRTADYIISRIRDYAMERKSFGDFACIMVIEEAQYIAPERGLEVKTSEVQSEVKSSMIETISQAGGYNVGLILMTQRPAYVSKSCISQCNSVSCFRLKSGNDQDAILMYTEYGSERLRDYLPGLADHEAMLWGIAVPTPFPVIAEIKVSEYPQKAAVFAKQAWEKMEKLNV